MKSLLLLLGLVVLINAQTTTYGNCTAADQDRCAQAAGSPTFPVCPSGTRPTFNPSTCCYNCRPASSTPPCTTTAYDACFQAVNSSAFPVCAAGQVPTFNQTSCCYNCRPTAVPPSPESFCPLNPEDIPACTTATPVRLSNGCPSCRPSTGSIYNCSAAALATCMQNIPNLPRCNGVPVQRTADCCISCNPTPVCTIAQFATCRANFDTLRACNAGEDPAFDITTCCRTCRRVPPPDERPTAAICSRLAFHLCLSRTDVCQPGEIPRRSAANFCCPTCKRPEDLCAKDDVIACWRNIPDCPAAVRPVWAAGDCCPSCRPNVRRVCAAACGPNQACVATGGNFACAPLRRIHFIVHHILAGANLTDADIVILIREVVQRFCSRADNAARCARFAASTLELDLLIASTVIVNRNGDDVTVDVPDIGGTTPAGPVKRQAAGSFGDVVVDAGNDPDATQGYQMVANNAGPTDNVATSSPKGNGAVSVVASVFTLLFALLLF